MVSKEIRSGIALLDKSVPGWEKKVDLSILNVEASAERCVLGQVFKEDFLSHGNEDKYSHCYSPYHYGKVFLGIEDEDQDYGFVGKTDEWIEAITKKKSGVSLNFSFDNDFLKPLKLIIFDITQVETSISTASYTSRGAWPERLSNLLHNHADSIDAISKSMDALACRISDEVSPESWDETREQYYGGNPARNPDTKNLEKQADKDRFDPFLDNFED